MVSDLRHSRSTSDRSARLPVAPRKAYVGSYLACALEPFGRSNLAYDDRGSLESDPQDHPQQREATLQLRILLDMLLNFFFQVFDLLFNLFEKATMRTASLIPSFI